MATSLSDQQLQELRRQLMNEYDQLRETVRQELLRSENEHFIDLAGRVHDDAEASVADLLADLGLQMFNRHKNELRDIEVALQRMDMGDYGRCIDCDEMIDYQRLRAYPMAIRCYDCQAQFERRGQEGNKSTL